MLSPPSEKGADLRDNVLSNVTHTASLLNHFLTSVPIPSYSLSVILENLVFISANASNKLAPVLNALAVFTSVLNYAKTCKRHLRYLP